MALEELKPAEGTAGDKALTTMTAEEQIMAQYQQALGGFTGTENFRPQDLRIPRVKIVQPTAKEGNAGTFLHNYGEEYSSMMIALVKTELNRIYWNPDPTQEEALCRSYDGLNPDSSIESPPCDRCTAKKRNKAGIFVDVPVCPMAIWKESEKDPRKKERPQCDEVIAWLCIDLDSMQAFWTQFSGSGIGPARDYQSRFALGGKPLFVDAVEMSLKAVTVPQKHYVPVFKNPRRLRAMELAKVLPMVVALKEATNKRNTELEEEVATDAVEETAEPKPAMPGFMAEEEAQSKKAKKA